MTPGFSLPGDPSTVCKTADNGNGFADMTCQLQSVTVELVSEMKDDNAGTVLNLTHSGLGPVPFLDLRCLHGFMNCVHVPSI